MTISLLGNIYATDYDYYITHLETKIDTNGDGQVMKMDIQQHIKELMAERGWTNYRLGKEASLSHSTITNLFKRNNAPTIPTLEAVCRAFGITLSQFFSEGNTPAELTEEQRTLFAAWSSLKSLMAGMEGGQPLSSPSSP